MPPVPSSSSPDSHGADSTATEQSGATIGEVLPVCRLHLDPNDAFKQHLVASGIRDDPFYSIATSISGGPHFSEEGASSTEEAIDFNLYLDPAVLRAPLTYTLTNSATNVTWTIDVGSWLRPPWTRDSMDRVRTWTPQKAADSGLIAPSQQPSSQVSEVSPGTASNIEDRTKSSANPTARQIKVVIPPDLIGQHGKRYFIPDYDANLSHSITIEDPTKGLSLVGKVGHYLSTCLSNWWSTQDDEASVNSVFHLNPSDHGTMHCVTEDGSIRRDLPVTTSQGIRWPFPKDETPNATTAITEEDAYKALTLGQIPMSAVQSFLRDTQGSRVTAWTVGNEKRERLCVYDLSSVDDWCDYITTELGKLASQAMDGNGIRVPQSKANPSEGVLSPKSPSSAADQTSLGDPTGDIEEIKTSVTPEEIELYTNWLLVNTGETRGDADLSPARPKEYDQSLSNGWFSLSPWLGWSKAKEDGDEL